MQQSDLTEGAKAPNLLTDIRAYFLEDVREDLAKAERDRDAARAEAARLREALEAIDKKADELLAVAQARAALAEPAQPATTWTCAARAQGTADGNAPADCGWPTCGCDPAADKVIAALQESGVIAEPAQSQPAGWRPIDEILAKPCNEPWMLFFGPEEGLMFVRGYHGDDDEGGAWVSPVESASLDGATHYLANFSIPALPWFKEAGEIVDALPPLPSEEGGNGR